MKTKMGGLLLCGGAALCLMAFRPHAAPPDLSSPKAAVRSFLDAVKSRDMEAVQQCVKGSLNQAFLKQVFTDKGALQIVSVNTLVEETENNATHVAAEITLQLPSSSQPNAKQVPVTIVEMFSLVKQGENWQLAPDPNFMDLNASIANESLGRLLEMRPLSASIAVAASPDLEKVLQQSRDAARAASCLSNAKQIVTGTLMYVQDYDELTPRKGPSYTELIFPYIKNRQVFTCPLDPNGTISYTFNSGATGVPLSAVTAPAKTVMIYEGKNGTLNYRHDGRAVVGFMDGHCKLITPDEARSLVWTVNVPKAAAKPAAKPTRKKDRK